MKQVLSTLLLLATLLLPRATTAFNFPSKTPLVTQVERSIVRVEYGDLLAQHAVCTGFVTSSSKGEALTARHCLPAEGEALFVDGVESEVLGKSDIFGLVSVAKMTKPPLPISEEEASIGSEVFTFGYGWGYMHVFHRFVAAFNERDLVMDNPLAHGMSGGPVVNLKGEVVGLNQAANEIIGLGCGVQEIRSFLKLR